MGRPLMGRRGISGECAAVIAVLALISGCVSGTSAQGGDRPDTAPQDITIGASRVFPESITSDAAGNIYVGSIRGAVYRAPAGATQATLWIAPDAANGLLSVFGVLADDAHGLLWVCSNPDMFRQPPQTGTSSLKAFALATGALSASYDFPAGRAACNDIAVARDGTVFATETTGGRIFSLAPGASELTLFAHEEALVGVDGIAFSADGTMYINNVRQNLFQRVNRKADGGYAGLTTLALDGALNGPDGLRPAGGNRFLQAEGPAGRVALLEVNGDSAAIMPVRTQLESSAGVARVGKVGYATEGKINYLLDPALRDKDPGTFVIRAFLLPEGL